MPEQSPRTIEIEECLRDRNVVQRLCEIILEDPDLAPGDESGANLLSYLSTFIGPREQIRDVLLNSGNGLNRLTIQGHQGGVLLLVDPQPHANWSHPCWIAAYDIARDHIEVIRHNFPPKETDDRRLVSFSTIDLTARPKVAP